MTTPVVDAVEDLDVCVGLFCNKNHKFVLGPDDLMVRIHETSPRPAGFVYFTDDGEVVFEKATNPTMDQNRDPKWQPVYYKPSN